MGRMFRIISERGGALAEAPPAAEPDTVPFVEVGGPEGVVTFGLPSASRVVPTEPAVVQLPAVESAVVHEPAPEPPARVLSVAYHPLPKHGLRLVPAGVSTDLVTVHWPDHPVSREYRAVRDEIKGQFGGGPRVLLFAAAVPETGATTVVLNLASTLAGEGGVKVVVVDANNNRPAVATRLALADAPGLAEVVAQGTPLAWAIQPTPVANLHALTAGTTGGSIADLPKLLGQLRQWFDWVFVDAGVWSDATAGSACDGVYFVTRQTDIDRPEFTALRASVTAAGGVPRGYLTTRE